MHACKTPQICRMQLLIWVQIIEECWNVALSSIAIRSKMHRDIEEEFESNASRLSLCNWMIDLCSHDRPCNWCLRTDKVSTRWSQFIFVQLASDACPSRTQQRSPRFSSSQETQVVKTLSRFWFFTSMQALPLLSPLPLLCLLFSFRWPPHFVGPELIAQLLTCNESGSGQSSCGC